MLPLVHIVAALFLLVIETVQAVLNGARLLSAMDLLGRELVIIVAAVVVLIPLGHVAGSAPWCEEKRYDVVFTFTRPLSSDSFD